MDIFKKKTWGLVAVAAGSAVGVVLRMVQMLCFFDFETGFYTDGGLAAWLSLLLPVLGAVLAGAVFFRGRSSFGGYAAGKGLGAGALAAVSGVLLVVQAARMLLDYQTYRKTGFSAYGSVQQGFIHLAFLVMCGVFGLVQLAVAGGYFTGKDIFAKAPLLYVAAVLWGMANMVMVYVFYAKFSSVVENLFSMVGAAALLLELLYLCRLLAGSDPARVARNFFTIGGLAVILTVTYTLPNIVLALMGKTYAGEMPIDCQLCSLSVALFLLAVMFFCQRKREERRGA